MWKQWVNFVVGVILVIMSLTAATVDVYYLIGGVIVAVLAIWSAMEKKGGPAMPH